MADAEALLTYCNTTFDNAFPPEIPKGAANLAPATIGHGPSYLAGILDQFNNGPAWAPPHCGELQPQ